MDRETLETLYDRNRAYFGYRMMICFMVEAIQAEYTNGEITAFLHNIGYTPGYIADCKAAAARIIAELEKK